MTRRILLATGIFILALAAGLIVGLTLFSPKQPATSQVVVDATATVEPEEQASLEFDGIIVVAANTRPATWTFDVGVGLLTRIDVTVISETLMITNGVQPDPGTWAHVEATKLPSGMQASSVALSPNPAPLTFEGVIVVGEDVPGNWIVQVPPATPVRFAVIDGTEVITRGMIAQPGAWVRVEANKLATGLQASVLELLPGPPRSSLFDRLVAIDNDVWLVGDTNVLVPPGTPISGTAQPGDYVYVTGLRSSDGLRAQRIQVRPAAAEVALQGTIRSMNGHEWQVDDVTVSVDGGTSIVGLPMVGREVQIVGVEEGSRRLRALKITVLATNAEQTMQAWLQNIDDTGLWHVTWLDGPITHTVTLTVGQETLVDTSLAPAEPGSWLEIRATPQGEAYYQAQQIRVLPHAPKLQIVGLVETMPSEGWQGRWRVAQYDVEASESTGILGSPSVGSLVVVSGFPDYENVLHAELIETIGN